jgi:MoxR-like ATPase
MPSALPASSLSSQEAALERLESQIERVFVGKHAIVRKSLTTFIAGGHLLIEDVPGVGKTTLALGLANSVGCTFQRIQFTSDLLPSDILGISLLNPKTQEFEFRKGPLFHQVILADELNRATPRTQSALLEAMNEGQVTVDNQTFLLPKPFFVVATQNPHEHHGAFPLPESQLDRFMMRLTIGYPDTQDEKTILNQGMEIDAPRHLTPCLSVSEISQWVEQVPRVRVAPAVDEYILALVQATRPGSPGSDPASRIEVGVSPRGALALRKAAQAHALMENRDYVTPDDVKALASAVLAHRIIFSSDQVSDVRQQAERLIENLLQTVPVPL